ncbi:MAG TPA: hypothetical protein VHM25_11215, partial [Polyangiaceae bacterium]|nr:hypothetical protein [Polyangiaceae bacterium]
MKLALVAAGSLFCLSACGSEVVVGDRGGGTGPALTETTALAGGTAVAGAAPDAGGATAVGGGTAVAGAAPDAGGASAVGG